MVKSRQPHPKSKRALMLALLADGERTTTELARLTDMNRTDARLALCVMERKGLVRLVEAGSGCRPNRYALETPKQTRGGRR